MYLNACQTLALDANGKSLGERIVEALPHLAVIGWRTSTEDKAAACFSRGFYDALARGMTAGGGGKVAIAEAFANGEEVFEQHGFVKGDPAECRGRKRGGMAVRTQPWCLAGADGSALESWLGQSPASTASTASSTC